jgi:putative tryptophan/tyrosine transport system substrate-binding protein
MRRREFIAAIAGAAVGSRIAIAQTTSKIYRVGIVNPGDPLSDTSYFGSAIFRGFARQGYAVGRNLLLDQRGAQGHKDRLPSLVDELVADQVDVFLVVGYDPVLAVKQQAPTIPAVITQCGDPVALGFVETLAHPGGNITGISDVSVELSPKRLELLKEMAPRLRRVAMLWNADNLGMTMRYRAAAEAAKKLGISVQPLGVREPEDFKEAFAAMTQDLPDAILMVADRLTTLNRRRVYDFAAEHSLPAIYEYDQFPRDGGLMSYGPDIEDTFERATWLIDRILKGAKPAELPFEQPTKFQLVINLKTAKTLGLTVPPLLLAQADEVIE